jgi:hypothetical protein
MFNDVVLDTNLLMHADDERQPHQEACAKLLADLRSGDTALCVDEGFDPDESKNRSLIGGEYYERLTATHTATGLIAYLFANGRVRLLPTKTPVAVKKCIEQCVKTKRDRTFLAVAHNSEEQVLGSYDYQDMQPKKRKHIESGTGVRVLDASQIRAGLRSD